MRPTFFLSIFKKSLVISGDERTKKLHQRQPIDSHNASYFIERGKSKASAKDFRGAIIDFSRSIELDPKSIEGYLERGKAKKMFNDLGGSEKDLAIARRLFDDLDSGLKANDDANTAYENGDYKNAIKFYNKALSLVPSGTSIYYYRGFSKQYLGDYKGALEDFNKSIEIGAANKDISHYQRGKIKSHELSDKIGALEDFNRAIELNPNDPDYYYSRAILVDDFDAIQDLNKAVELDPDDANNYLARSLRRRNMEDLEGSILDLTKYIALNPKESLLSVSDAYSLRASMKILQNDIEGALTDYNKAVKYGPSNEKALVERGIARNLLRDIEGAISDFDRAIELNPNYPDAYFHRGSVKQNNGLADDGLKDMIKAKSLGFQDE